MSHAREELRTEIAKKGKSLSDEDVQAVKEECERAKTFLESLTTAIRWFFKGVAKIALVVVSICALPFYAIWCLKRKIEQWFQRLNS